MGRDSGSDTEPEPVVPKHFREGFFAGFKSGANYQAEHGRSSWATPLYEINSWLRSNPKEEAKLRSAYFNEAEAKNKPTEQRLEEALEEIREMKNERVKNRDTIRTLEYKLKQVAKVCDSAGEKLKPLTDDLMATLADVAHRARCIELSKESNAKVFAQPQEEP